MNDCKVDVVEEGFDVVIWVGYLFNLVLVVKKIIIIYLVLCVLLVYLEKYGIFLYLLELKLEYYLEYVYVNYDSDILELMKVLKMNV